MRKGQVTFFVIIGIAIIIAASSAYLLFGTSNLHTSVPDSFKPLKVAISNCAESALTGAIKNAGENGGYIFTQTNLNDAQKQKITEEFAQYNGIHYPYYNRLKPSCTSQESGANSQLSADDCFVTFAPPLQSNSFNSNDYSYSKEDYSVEAQMASYVNYYGGKCLQKYVSNSNEYNGSNVGIKSDITITDKKVSYQAKLNGTVNKGSSQISDIVAEGSVPSSFYQAYNTAKDIAYYDYTTAYFGYYLMDMISLASSPSGEYPPMFDIALNYNINSWTSQKVEKSLSGDMNKYLPFLRLTDFESFSGMQKQDFNSLPYPLRRSVIDMKLRGRSGVGSYLGDSFSLNYVPSDLQPKVKLNGRYFSRGQEISSPAALLNALIPIRYYVNHYDIDAPILLSLKSKSDNLVYNFALLSSIRANQPVLPSTTIVTEDNSSESYYTDLIKAANPYCSHPQGSNAQIQITDASTNAPFTKDTAMLFQCGQKSCSYQVSGSTDLKLPFCKNAKVIFEKTGYGFSSQTLDTTDTSSPVQVNSIAYSPLDIKFDFTGYNISRKIAINPLPPHIIHYVNDTPRKLGPDEEVVITLQGIDSNYNNAVVLNYNSPTKTISIYPGDYSGSVTVIKNLTENITIPRQKICLTALCIIELGHVDKIDLSNSEVEASTTFTKTNPLHISPGDSSISLNLPVYDLANIPESDRKADDLKYFGKTDEYIANDSKLGVMVK